MKKIFTLLVLLIATIGFAQNSGITYQAVIYGPNGQQLPGVNNQQYILANKTICLRFSIIDQLGQIEYKETIVTTTDKFGMVNLLIGTGNQVGGYATGFNGIVWNANRKSLKVELDPSQNCQNFTEISNNPFTYVPFAYYSANPGEPGPVGPVGPQGPAGVNGTNGINGAIGPQGIQGEQGPIGLTGPAGPQGVTGSNGLSAYQIWLNAGNSGTETQFLTSLQGPIGPVGPTGPTGPQGVTGSNGLSAYQIWLNAGNSGTETQFLASLQGPTGPVGATGPQGIAGINATGYKCPQLLTLLGPIDNSAGMDTNFLFPLVNCNTPNQQKIFSVNNLNSKEFILKTYIGNYPFRNGYFNINIVCYDANLIPVTFYAEAIRSGSMIRFHDNFSPTGTLQLTNLYNSGTPYERINSDIIFSNSNNYNETVSYTHIDNGSNHYFNFLSNIKIFSLSNIYKIEITLNFRPFQAPSAGTASNAVCGGKIELFSMSCN